MGAPDGRTGGPDYTTTGYLMRKFLDEDGVDILRGVFVNRHGIISVWGNFTSIMQKH